MIPCPRIPTRPAVPRVNPSGSSYRYRIAKPRSSGSMSDIPPLQDFSNQTPRGRLRDNGLHNALPFRAVLPRPRQGPARRHHQARCLPWLQDDGADGAHAAILRTGSLPRRSSSPISGPPFHHTYASAHTPYSSMTRMPCPS